MSSGPDEDSSGTSADRSSSEYVTIAIIAFLLILPVFVLEKVHKKVARTSDAKRTGRLMLAVIISNTIFAIIIITRSTMCLNCIVQSALFYDIRWFMKWFNLLFLIHRAKLAQGMTPILSKKWFNKILPRIVTGFIFILMLIMTDAQFDLEFICEAYIDNEGIEFCYEPKGRYSDAVSDGDTVGVGIFLGFDLVVTVCLVTLFVVPLYRVYGADLGVLNDNQLRQRLKLRTLLIWSVAMCCINQITSTFLLLNLFAAETQAMSVLINIGMFDPAINVWTSWLMITRNRLFLWELTGRLSCCKHHGERFLSRAQSVISDMGDMPSRTNTNLSSKEVTRSQSSSGHSSVPKRSITDVRMEVVQDPKLQKFDVS